MPSLDTRKVDPKISPATSDERPVQAMFLADTHLLGSRKGHWYDKLRRYNSVFCKISFIENLKNVTLYKINTLIESGNGKCIEHFKL